MTLSGASPTPCHPSRSLLATDGAIGVRPASGKLRRLLKSKALIEVIYRLADEC